jgi:hypothetical protein
LNPLLIEATASILRHVLTSGAVYLVARGIWTPEEASTYAAAAAMGLIGIGWSLYQKHEARIKLVTALAMPIGTTEETLEKTIAQGEQAAVSTPKTEIPFREAKP